MTSEKSLTDARTERRGFTSARISLGKIETSLPSNFVLLLGVTLFLVAFGLVMVASSSTIDSYLDSNGFFGGFWKQATYAAIGIPLMLVMSRFPISFWKAWAWPVIVGSVALQMLVFTPLGIEDGGNRNWIAIGPISGQPSEIVKVALVIWLATVLARKQPLLGKWQHVLIPVLPVAGLAIGLVLLGHDLGTVSIMAAIVLGALFFANVKLRFLAVPVIGGVALLAAFALTSENRMRRITSFLDAECLDYEGLCWQPLHGTWALAGGGIFGRGLGNSHEKWAWLPAASNDYIFAIIGEELGLIGCVVLLGLFVVMTIVFVRIMRSSTDPFTRIATGTVMVWIIGQAFVNIGVVLRVFPVLGVPLPFISAGGTALLTGMMAIGVVLSCARHDDASLARAKAGQ
ncbi:putative lipid II flippase FtsW [Paramicrobacterium agarici]|uniref:Probable peptidoglycan glycosyltransferase FtsW n=1 Tax=Paramicrobacterium agarici TaxID=630514 RepID=A0A2A9DZQ2_9MICO|nr:putative lipid II flippase FtsW [Microbacterium agarici]PFG31452.1 cell division-specific peptidoglycan biosynthesis regulator FtsW [Microbacterium agarici]TQO21340.1 cell division-specific peptidoglycan biosynthesis regulator FtsW [Microbacterium agarici]